MIGFVNLCVGDIVHVAECQLQCKNVYKLL